MIRVLFIILAVVSMALAFVLSISWLYLVSAAMLITAAVILTLDTRKRLRRSAVAGSRAAPSTPKKKEDLASLGIMEIRPKGGNGAASEAETKPPSQNAAGEPVLAASQSASKTDSARPDPLKTRPGGSIPDLERVPPAPASSGKASQTMTAETDISRVGVVRKRARTARIMVEGVSEGLRSEVVLSTLRALRAAVDATTIALLRQEDGPLGYSLEAIVSRNSFARSGGRFTVAEPLISAAETLTPVVNKCTGPDGFNARRLGYYHEPIAVHKVAFVPFSGDGASFLLVADSMADEAFDDAEALRMLREFARLIRALVVEAAPPSGEPTPSREHGLRPRREIIAEEIEAARGDSGELALALVHLNKGEDAGGASVSASEEALSRQLELAAAGGRVERFGELTFGIFRRGNVDEMVEWASELHRGLGRYTDSLGGSISVGVAMLDERHDGPDALRSDATAALRESYETGECVILE